MALMDIPLDIEELRDASWCRDESRAVATPFDAERFVERLGFASCLSDSRRPGPSLFVAVCGRRDAVMPRNVQTDPESSLTWNLKDALLRRGAVYYAKFGRGRTMFLAPRMIPHFNAVFGVTRAGERTRLSPAARAILTALRHEWEMGTKDLRDASGVTDRATFTKALDELQAAMLVIPSDVVYQPTFTYLWTVAVGRFPDQLRTRVRRDTALREIARAFLTHAHLTVRGELARVTGLSRADAGLGNQALVAEGFAERVGAGVYRKTSRGRLT